MITNLIVLLSLTFAAGFIFIWFMRKDFREQIEQPKYRFQDQINHFETQSRLSASSVREEVNHHD
jgi:hypothetical protein